MGYQAKIYFMRHGQSLANARNVFAGQRDNSKLTAVGIRQAHSAAEYILRHKLRFNHILTSPLQRTKETAEIVARGIGFDPYEIVIEPRLAEYDMGLLSGTPIHPITSAEIIAHPEAEDPIMLRRRLQQVLERVHAMEGSVLLVSHAGTGRMFESMLAEADPNDFYDMAGFGNGSVAPLYL